MVTMYCESHRFARDAKSMRHGVWLTLFDQYILSVLIERCLVIECSSLVHSNGKIIIRLGSSGSILFSYILEIFWALDWPENWCLSTEHRQNIRFIDKLHEWMVRNLNMCTYFSEVFTLSNPLYSHWASVNAQLELHQISILTIRKNILVTACSCGFDSKDLYCIKKTAWNQLLVIYLWVNQWTLF